MAAAIARLLSDHELRERMFRYNVAHAPSQDWPHVVDITLAEYRRAATLRGLTLAGR